MSTQFIGRPVEILLVEDNPGDVVLMQEALQDGKVLNHLHVVGDGVEAMAFLRGAAPYQDKPRPDLVLLDLNLPRKSGPEVLAEIKADDSLRRIPVVILTVSSDERDVLKAYDLHANCFISKPVRLAQFVDVIKSIKHFWLAIVTLPPKGHDP
jgi:CheY-like chemotaxis protein